MHFLVYSSLYFYLTTMSETQDRLGLGVCQDCTAAGHGAAELGPRDVALADQPPTAKINK